MSVSPLKGNCVGRWRQDILGSFLLIMLCYFPVLPFLWLSHASLGVLVEQLPECGCVWVCVSETEGSLRWALPCDCKGVQAAVEPGLEVELHSWKLWMYFSLPSVYKPGLLLTKLFLCWLYFLNNLWQLPVSSYTGIELVMIWRRRYFWNWYISNCIILWIFIV